MNEHDPFEQHLRRQPLRPVPAVWREGILARAEEAARVHRRHASVPPPTFAAAAWVRLREWFWPCPQAWAGLGAAWVVILVVNLAMPGDAPETRAQRAELPSREMWHMLKQQRQMLAELGGPADRGESGQPTAPGPQPRSQHRNPLRNA